MDIKLSKIARSRINNYLTGLLIIVAAVLLSWLSSRVEFQFDWTREGRHTLSEASKALLDKLGDPVHIVAYARDDVNLRNAIRNIIERYQRQKSDIHLRFVNPDIAPDEVRELGISAAVELILTYQGRSEHVQSITEQEITNALQRLARGAERWIAFIEGHGERNPLGKANHDLQEWGRQLQNKGFTVQPINLAEIQSIPVSTRVLVIAGPSVKLLPGELDLIATYIESGGNLLWLVDPGDQHGLETIADKLDIKIEPGLIIDFAGRLIGLDDPSIVMQTPSLNPPHPAINNFDLTTFFPTATVISSKNESNWVFSPLVSTGDHTWLETGKLEGEVNFDEGKDRAGPLTLGISLERTLLIEEENRQYNRDQRIIVIGDGDFLSNTYVANAGNMEFGTRIMNWLSFDDDLISIPTTTAADSQLQLSTFATGLIAFGFLIILPLALGATGVSIWWFRRKQ